MTPLLFWISFKQDVRYLVRAEKFKAENFYIDVTAPRQAVDEERRILHEHSVVDGHRDRLGA